MIKRVDWTYELSEAAFLDLSSGQCPPKEVT